MLLNGLRTEAREVEIATYQAFKTVSQGPEGVVNYRAFICLSSVFYVMMFKAKAGEYA